MRCCLRIVAKIWMVLFDVPEIVVPPRKRFCAVFEVTLRSIAGSVVTGWLVSVANVPGKVLRTPEASCAELAIKVGTLVRSGVGLDVLSLGALAIWFPRVGALLT